MWYIALFLVFLAADQAVKLWVVQHLDLYESAPLLPGFLELRYIRNTGGGWSVLSDYTWLLSILTALIMLVLLYLLLRRIVRHPLGRTACVLLLAGGGHVQLPVYQLPGVQCGRHCRGDRDDSGGGVLSVPL